jgi:hypothetical protein
VPRKPHVVSDVYLTDALNFRERVPTSNTMISALAERYRCPDDSLQFELAGRFSADSGFFCFGPETICYGRSTTGYRTRRADAPLYSALPDLHTTGSTVRLSFSPTEVIDNLRLERYATRYKCSEKSGGQRFLRNAYYAVRPLLGVNVRKHLQRVHASGWRDIAFPRWPVDVTVEHLSEALLLASIRARGVDRIPFVWFWPRGAKSCVVMTHDVEAESGHSFCRHLMDIEEAQGIKASFQLTPEGSYTVSESLVQEIRDRGFEVNVHDLNHDGRLFSEQQEFLRRVKKINDYAQAYAARGFRSAVMYRNLDWYDALNVSYDMSVPNVAHLDPQHGGCCTVMPYFVGDILEIPLTTIQDYMLFHYLGDYSLDLWKAQAEAILKKNGLMSFLIHPDYVMEKRARDVYCDLLCFLRNLGSQERLWFALPGEVDQWWRERSKMRVVNYAGEWRIEGPRKERAVLAFAKAFGDHVEYEVSTELEVV